MLLILAVLSVLHAAPTTDPIAGTWRIQGDVVGNAIDEVCTIQQQGTALSGSCVMAGKSYDLAGEVKDGTVTFRHGGEYQGEALTIIYSGTLASPRELKGTVEVLPYGVAGEFTAVPVAAQP